MTTPQGVGYYDLLDPSEQHILIGYSQGGLVARYLGFLDRLVFGQNKIAAVFTVSSPNQGAPFGNPANQQTVSAGLVEVLASLLSFHEDKFKKLFDAIANTTSFDSLYGLLAAANEDARDTQHEARGILDSAVKWLSGLHNDPNTAFAEIGANNFNHDLSVLSLVNRPDNAEVYTGAVISANNRLQDILQSLVMGGRSEGLLHKFMEDLETQGLRLLGHLHLFGITINDNENAASLLYETRVIVDPLPGDSDKMTILRKSYEAGMAEIPRPLFGNETIPSFAHDYVIPSVYQLLPENSRLLGQHVNLQASHNSGKSPALAGGAENITALHKLLETFCNAVRDDEQEKGSSGDT
jgi:hypothetical protein